MVEPWGAGAGAPLGRLHADLLGLAPGGMGQLSPSPSAAPSSNAGQGGVGGSPRLILSPPPPTTSRVMAVCWAAPVAFCAVGGVWKWGWGQNELWAQFPHVPQKRMYCPIVETHTAMGYGKGVPPVNTSSGALRPPSSDWWPPGQADPLSSAWGAVPTPRV